MIKKLIELFKSVGLTENLSTYVTPIPMREPAVNGERGKLLLDDVGKPQVGAFIINWRYASLLNFEDVVACLSDTQLYASNPKDTSQARLLHAKEECKFEFKPSIYLNKSIFSDDVEDLLKDFDK